MKNINLRTAGVPAGNVSFFCEDCLMKHPLSFLVLSLVAARAQAFTAQIPSEQTGNAEATTRASMAFFSFHSMNMKTLQIGVCDAISVNGCNCPFCTQLRSLGR